MIIDVLENANLYREVNSKFNKAFNFLRNMDLLKLDMGKYEIEGTNIYAIVDNYFTRSKEEGLWEAHRRYIDIQFVVKNKEQMGYASLGQMQIAQNMTKKKIFYFLKEPGAILLCLLALLLFLLLKMCICRALP